jgi:hypothetical protein
MAAERERPVDVNPEVLEGDDEIPREPAPPLDPYTPEPAPRRAAPREFRVMWLAWLVLIAVIAIVVWAAFH